MNNDQHSDQDASSLSSSSPSSTHSFRDVFRDKVSGRVHFKDCSFFEYHGKNDKLEENGLTSSHLVEGDHVHKLTQGDI